MSTLALRGVVHALATLSVVAIVPTVATAQSISAWAVSAEPVVDEHGAAAQPPARNGNGEKENGNGKRNGAEEEEGPVKIHDNSFLIEEGYNQEQGLVQHIFNWVPSWEHGNCRQNTFDFVFTQEWPICSQTHQFSYTLPMLYLAETDAAGRMTQAQGFGDVLLNYRYQLWNGEGNTLACAPRFSVILPTGEVESGLGNGVTGYQINFPFSKTFDRAAMHFNAGATWVPDARGGLPVGIAPQTLNGYHVGGSFIRFLKPNFHLMLETIAIWDEEVSADGTEDPLFIYLLSPGFRWAPFTEGDTQWVIGAAVPVGLSTDAPDLGLFLYMSFEHRVAKKRGE